ncbi:MAG: hypothetical protein PHT07_04175 [Paludibacter sp.]|nr:hypothetical protein [Paludibacter sp.]
MKKFLSFIALFFVMFVIIGILSKVIIIVRYGQGHEITIGKNEESNVPEYDPDSKQIIPSIISYSTFLTDYSEVTGTEIRILSTLKKISADRFLNPLKSNALIAIEIPLLLEKPVQLPTDFYLRQETLYLDFLQKGKTDAALNQQLNLDILAVYIHSQNINLEKTDRYDDFILNKHKNFNVPGIDQTGSYNLSLQQQTGVLNIAMIHQLGNSNISIQTQNGIGNNSNSFQSGSMNVSVQDQKSFFSTADIIQSGIINIARQAQDQEISGGYNETSANQTGVNNNSLQKQNGVLNHSLIVQSGIGNTGDQSQTGNMNDALIDQRSENSVASQTQNSGLIGIEKLNKAEIYQAGGSHNFAVQTQDSNEGNLLLNNAIIRQNGYLNFASQTQTIGNSTSTISQYGTNNNAIVCVR